MPNEPRIWIVKEIPHNHKRGEKIRIHEITIPHLREPGGYTQAISLEYFQHGKRKFASAQDKKHYHDRACWGPKALFCLKPKDIFDKEEEGWNESFRLLNIERPNNQTARRIKHKSVQDFYAHIGFDRKNRCYVDKLGNPIKFSVLPPVSDPQKP